MNDRVQGHENILGTRYLKIVSPDFDDNVGGFPTFDALADEPKFNAQRKLTRKYLLNSRFRAFEHFSEDNFQTQNFENFETKFLPSDRKNP